MADVLGQEHRPSEAQADSGEKRLAEELGQEDALTGFLFSVLILLPAF